MDLTPFFTDQDTANAGLNKIRSIITRSLNLKFMKTNLIKLSLRQNAIYLPELENNSESVYSMSETTAVLVANCAKLGFGFSEKLLRVIDQINAADKMVILQTLREVTNVDKNWTPLIRQWNIPTGESFLDHLKIAFANFFPGKSGTTLACGHLIPENTFPLERYNGCPFCGTPFTFEELEYEVDKVKTLDLWTENDLTNYAVTLCASPVALSATQSENLKIYLSEFEVPSNTNITMKETQMLVIDQLVEMGKTKEAGAYFKSPVDILRYLWYKHTGYLQIIEPKVIINRMTKNARHFRASLDTSNSVNIKAQEDLKLKFSRTEAKIYAQWINNLTLDIDTQCALMHPKRGIWVRVIRALRLGELSKRKGYEKLRELLDKFYNQDYEVWQGRVDYFKLKNDAVNTFALLKKRPGLFARSLFSTMLWFGHKETLKQFQEIMDQVPARLIYTLYMYADIYFTANARRTVKPLGGVDKVIPTNKMVNLYPSEQLSEIKEAIKELTLLKIKQRFIAQKNVGKSIYIDEALYNIPIAIGDRSQQIHDLPEALMGTRFPVEGDTVRLFMQWGAGLSAQHLDMDLSCLVAYENREEFCSYSQLTIAGCQHSGDIRSIPEKVGTAEYIDLNLAHLGTLGAKYVSFTCNAYSNGSLSPNLVVGWMNSKDPMKISKRGVAYNPSSVQHQVRIKGGLAKGMAFGILDVEARSILWLEMEFGGQIIQKMSTKAVEALLQKLEAKLKIGDLLKLKSKCQKLEIVTDPDSAEEVYDNKWALNSTAVSALFLGD